MYRLPGLSLRAADLVVELAVEAFPDWIPKVGRLPKLDVVGAGRRFGIPGYRGSHPIKERPGRKLTEDEHRFNVQVASIRYVVEQAIAHIKNWRIMTTRYRGHLDRINNVILATVGLHALNDHSPVAVLACPD